MIYLYRKRCLARAYGFPMNIFQFRINIVSMQTSQNGSQNAWSNHVLCIKTELYYKMVIHIIQICTWKLLYLYYKWNFATKVNACHWFNSILQQYVLKMHKTRDFFFYKYFCNYFSHSSECGITNERYWEAAGVSIRS